MPVGAGEAEPQGLLGCELQLVFQVDLVPSNGSDLEGPDCVVGPAFGASVHVRPEAISAALTDEGREGFAADKEVADLLGADLHVSSVCSRLPRGCGR